MLINCRLYIIQNANLKVLLKKCIEERTKINIVGLYPEICMRKAKVQIHKKSLYRRIRSDSRFNQRATAITIVTTKLK